MIGWSQLLSEEEIVGKEIYLVGFRNSWLGFPDKVRSR
jgi:hypothetical protein